MKRTAAWTLIGVLLWAMLPQPARGQDTVFPLPAPLYVLAADQTLNQIDPISGAVTPVSPPGQPVMDFDIAPDGAWYVYRTLTNNAVIVSEIGGGSGYVLQFDEYVPPQPTRGGTITWSPDAAAIAYTVLEGVRIARLGAGEYGEAVTDTVPGAWVELYWAGPGILVASDVRAAVAVIEWQDGRWLTRPGDLPARPQPAVMSFLEADGVTLDDYRTVPGTAGALAFDWGPLRPPLVETMSLPANLYFIAHDPVQVPQVWVLPKDNALPRVITAEPSGVTGYSVSPDQQRIAYVNLGHRLIVAEMGGLNRRELAQIDESGSSGVLDWSPDGTQIAYDDGRGIWVVPADGSQPPRIVAQSTFSEDNPIDVRVLRSPQWNTDGSKLLIGIGFYEGGTLGSVDVNTGSVTDLSTEGSVSEGIWTTDGRVITWAAGWGYTVPGLYLLTTDLPPGILIDARHAVFGAAQGADGRVYAAVGSTVTMGPQALTLWGANSAGPLLTPLFAGTPGGFIEQPQIAPPSGSAPLMVAGLDTTVEAQFRYERGDLLLLIPEQSTTLRVQTPGLVWRIQWGN
jgi:Tol biopolymer transport system component